MMWPTWYDHGLEEALNYVHFYLLGMLGEKKSTKQKRHPCGDSKRNMLVSPPKFLKAGVC